MPVAPKAAPVRLELASTLRVLRRPNDAIRELRQAVKIDPKFARAWQVLGEMLSDRGEEEAAEEAFRQQMAASSQHPGLTKAVQLGRRQARHG